MIFDFVVVMADNVGLEWLEEWEPIGPWQVWRLESHIDGLMQDCSNSSALTLELLQSAPNHRVLISAQDSATAQQ